MTEKYPINFQMDESRISGAFETALAASREMFRKIFEAAREGICCFDAMTKEVMLANEEFCRITGYTKNELSSLHARDIYREKSVSDLIDEIKEGRSEKSQSGEIEIIRKDRSILVCQAYGISVVARDHKLWVGFFRDVSKEKTAKHELDECRLTIENQKTMVEQKNSALSELAEHIERSKKKIETDMIKNIEAFITPIIKKIRVKGVSKKQVDLLQNYLNELTTSFGSKITNVDARLSLRETEICGMIKNGLSSKEISDMLHISHKTVNKHRNNIRTKLGIANKKINLATYLQKL
jgi:PAS domain S-box-containing protein